MRDASLLSRSKWRCSWVTRFYVKCLQAISIGSVFFGANTYIGNGPNFMVKAIADQQKAHTPTFLGYIFRFTLPYMLPMLVIVWWLFFRN